ncbi:MULTISPECIES: hypothetical protein [unclassified Rhodococcus (in: high G+C Gram-positive bacteria)]|uniref:hypothetical protein n=1 Tax=unclassified Rhodococcus (in: high G+C Gram-positive bacteria) TaxID=192944 RepID=UPI0024B6954D|nr:MULTISPECIES: hypothetical protein [unclassified Rhodococcus (in: high G+C Gram-positive bacteria)]MDI9927227.1 hypothetical protein [Rhodococcus sp. IEGM 1341]MDV8078396.1 hypothetical protein [Rhodococcus sp. IEGM 1370]
MRSVVLAFAALGFTVGLLASVSGWADTLYVEPGQRSRAYATTADVALQVRVGLFLEWWTKVQPIIGAVVGAAVGFTLHCRGFRLLRVGET